MRLFHLAGYGGPYAGSFVPALRSLIGVARERGWTCEVVLGPMARERPWLDGFRADGIPFRFCESTRHRQLATGIASLLAERDDPVVLHTHFTVFDVPSVIAARGRSDTAVIWHVHTPFRAGLGMKARNVAKYTVFGRGAAQILCASQELATGVVQRGAPRRRVSFLHNAIDLDRFPQPTQAERASARTGLGLPVDLPVLLHFGWDWHRKGGDLFCEALVRLRDLGCRVVGLTVGGGSQALSLRRRLGLSEAELRITDATDCVSSLYSAADIFVSASRAEGTPYAVMEAAASGNAVVMTDISGHKFIASNLPSARLTGHDAQSIAAAVQSLLSREPLRTATEAQAEYEWLRRHVDLRAWSWAVVDRYERTLRPPDND